MSGCIIRVLYHDIGPRGGGLGGGGGGGGGVHNATYY